MKPNLQIEYVDPKKLEPSPYNPRTWTEEALKGLRASISEFGIVDPFVINKRKGLRLVGGHMRCKVAIELGIERVPIVYVDLDDKKEKALNVALNSRHIAGDWTADLGDLLGEIQADLPDLFADLNFEDLLADVPEVEICAPAGETDPDEVPEVTAEPILRLGDLVLLGRHRILCGDSCKAEDVDRLMDGKRAVLLHADPPYGMGKEKEGVANDNQYGANLDAFQLLWWHAFRPHLNNNASAYIWGNSEDLWRLWFVGGLRDSERLTFRNEITWDKGGGGMAVGTEAGRMYQSSERCFVFMLGEQGFNTNADNYWEGWEPIRKYLYDEAEKIGINNSNAYNSALGLKTSGGGMYAHHISPTGGQWCFLTKKHYEVLQKLAQGKAFKRDYEELKHNYEKLKQDFCATRAYFDNTHENMTDVWEYNRVQGEERQGHATPKPVDMIARAVKSSCPVNEIVIEPFLGSGSTLIACHQTNRICYGMEISPAYVEVSLRRWINFTNKPDEVKVIREGQEYGWGELQG